MIEPGGANLFAVCALRAGPTIGVARERGAGQHHTTTMTTTRLAFDRLGACFVLVQGERDATDEEWSRWVDFVVRGGNDLERNIRVLVVSAGGSPTPKQRARIHEVMPKMGGGVPTAIVTSSRIGRVVVSTMALFNSEVRAFAPSELDRALAYLGVPDASQPALRALVARLHTTLGLSPPG